jgi:hypothetical protein
MSTTRRRAEFLDPAGRAENLRAPPMIGLLVLALAFVYDRSHYEPAQER